MTFTMLRGDALSVLRTLPDESVHCAICSPPYFGLRSYLQQDDPAKPLEIGLEKDLATHIETLVTVFRELRRVLRKDGVFFMNYGDAYSGSWGAQSRGEGVGEKTTMSGGQVYAAPKGTHTGSTKKTGLKPKDRMMLPARLAIALCDDGWWLRDEIIFHKLNPMPTSVHDRTTPAHEMVYMFSKSARYFYDAFAIREPANSNTHARTGKIKAPDGWDTGAGGHGTIHRNGREKGRTTEVGRGIKNNESMDAALCRYVPSTRNKRSVWSIATEPSKDDSKHYACVDDETEALTLTGWKRHAELADGDMIAAYDRDIDTLVWQTATFNRYLFEGELISIDKRNSSQRLTPNHRCLVWRPKIGVSVVDAAKLNPAMYVLTSATLSPLIEKDGPSEDFAALLGWYLTEGQRRRCRIIQIHQSQSANPLKVEQIRALLRRLKATFHERKRTREWRGRPSVEITFCVTGDVADALQKYSPDKRINLDWLNWPTSSIRSLLDAIIDGDGHRRPGSGRVSIFQKDRTFLDSAQILALRLGWRTHVNRKEDGHVLYVAKGGWLTLRSANGKCTPIASRKYTGTVWCPTVGSGFWIARRNGKTFITGNSFPTALVLPMIKAGTSEKGCCARCGAPWRRKTEKGDVQRAKRSSTSNASHVPDEHPHTAMREAGYPRNGHVVKTTGWSPGCTCDAPIVPCTVLDCFVGSGTTALVTDRLGRHCIGIELSDEYADYAERRVREDRGQLFDDRTAINAITPEQAGLFEQPVNHGE